MSAGTPAAERRQQARLPAQLMAEYKIGGRVAKSQTGDLSEGGLFLYTGHLAPPGSRIFLRLHLGAGEPVLKIVGVVRRAVRAAPGVQPGLGVQFQVLYGKDASFLKRFLVQSLGRQIDEEAFGAADTEGTLKFIFEPDRTGPGLLEEEDAILPSSTPAVKPREWPSKVARLDDSSEGEEKAAAALRKAGLGGHTYDPNAIDDARALKELEFSSGHQIVQKIINFAFLAAIAAGLYFGYGKLAAFWDSLFHP